MDIYIKPKKKVRLEERQIVYIKDVAEVYAQGGHKEEEINQTIVFQIKDNKKNSYLISVIDIIKALAQKYPDDTLNNVGEMDILLEYIPQKPKKNPFIHYAKVVFVVLILFFGASTAIMSFHTDGEIPEIFKTYYKIFFQEAVDTPYIIDIPYSIGLAVGIIVFFNHFSKLHLSQDPTPIEVQMSTYGKEVVDSKINVLSQQKETQNKEKNHDST